MNLYGISREDARERLQLQERVSALAETLANENPDSFGGVWIQHEPTYKIMVAFKDASTRSAIRSSIEPAMRRYVQIQNVRNSVTERDRIVDRLSPLLLEAGIRFVTRYDYGKDKITLQVGSDQGVGRVRQLLPQDLQSEIQVERASIPERTQATGARAGDHVYPGWSFSASSGALYSCSWAFAATDNMNRQGILTAAHCPDTPSIYYATPGPRWVTFAAPRFSWNASNTKYDYQFHLTAGLITGAWLSFNNSSTKIDYTAPDGTAYKPSSPQNVISGYPASGYFAVIGTSGYNSQVAGNVMCKTGQSSGFTCGQITNGYYTYNGARGWIESARSSQFMYVTRGDSGGGVFTAPNAKGEIKAAGIVTAATIYDPTPMPDGSTDYSGDEKPCLSTMKNNPAFSTSLAPGVAFTNDCCMIHMPIDYVDDQQLLTIMTQPAQP